MNSFYKNIVTEVAKQSNIDIKKLENKCVVAFSGRFQPFHTGHYAAYKHLCEKFGDDNVYITTSNSTNNTDSPFSFANKVKIITELFGIPEDKIVKTEQPYRPDELLSTIKSKKTSLILAIGSKDVGRIYDDKSYVRYNGICTVPYTEKYYYYEIPSSYNLTSGTVIRNSLTTTPTKQNFYNIYNKYNAKIFKLIVDKLAKTKQNRVEYYTDHYKNPSPSDFNISRTGNKIIIEVNSSLSESDSEMHIPSDVRKLHRLFKSRNYKLYVVGGAVRDFLMGKEPKDFDLVTDAHPDEVVRIAIDNDIPYNEVGKSFGVVVIDGMEIATMRKDIGSGRRPDSVEYTDIHGDVQRRDLTINALFYDLDKNEIVDLVGGVDDIKNKRVRTVGNAVDRFDEDPLRKLRALRFAFRTSSKLDDSVYDALANNPSLDGVSPERIRDEFIKTLNITASTSEYLTMLYTLGMFDYVFPSSPVDVDESSFIDDHNYKLVIAYIFKDANSSIVSKYLNTLKYSADESNDIKFLINLSKFKSELIEPLKKEQRNVKLADSDIIRWGKHVGIDLSKFVKFKLSVLGNDVMRDGFKSKAVGDEIRRREAELYNSMTESVSDKNIKTFRDLFNLLPDELKKRVMGLKNIPQRLDYHPEGNTLKHTIMVVTRALKADDIDLAIAAMIHDIGKDSTAKFNPKTGYDSHIGHENVSADLVKQYSSWIRSLGGNPANIYYIVKNHMKMKQFDKMKQKKKDKLSSFRAFPKLSTFASKFDKGGLGESNTPTKTITFLVGPPASGKSTWVSKNKTPNTVIISRDDLVDEIRTQYNLSYTESFLNKELQNKVNVELENHIKRTLKSGSDIIVDMTNMTKFSRKRLIDRLPDGYIKKAVVFEVPREELNRRLSSRAKATGKDIPSNVVDRMIASYEPPTEDEFDSIEIVKSHMNEGYLYIADAEIEDSDMDTQLVEFWDDTIEEAEYKGRKVKLNKPMRGDVKKFKVYVKDPVTGNVKKVNFGDPEMRIKKSDPERRKSFRARHNCDNPGPKTKARYWSCKKW